MPILELEKNINSIEELSTQFKQLTAKPGYIHYAAMYELKLRASKSEQLKNHPLFQAEENYINVNLDILKKQKSLDSIINLPMSIKLAYNVPLTEYLLTYLTPQSSSQLFRKLTNSSSDITDKALQALASLPLPSELHTKVCEVVKPIFEHTKSDYTRRMAAKVLDQLFLTYPPAFVMKLANVLKLSDGSTERDHELVVVAALNRLSATDQLATRLKIIGTLILRLKEPQLDSSVRKNTIEELLDHLPPRCPRELLQKVFDELSLCLNAKDEELVYVALMVLKRLPLTNQPTLLNEVFNALLPLLDHSDEKIRSEAAAVRARLLKTDQPVPLNRVHDVPLQKIEKLPTEPSNDVSNVISTMDMLPLGQGRHPKLLEQAVNALLSFLNQSNEKIRSDAIFTLGHLALGGQPKLLEKVVKTLLPFLNQSNEKIRSDAISTLGRLALGSQFELLEKVECAFKSFRGNLNAADANVMIRIITPIKARQIEINLEESADLEAQCKSLFQTGSAIVSIPVFVREGLKALAGDILNQLILKAQADELCTNPQLMQAVFMEPMLYNELSVFAQEKILDHLLTRYIVDDTVVQYLHLIDTKAEFNSKQKQRLKIYWEKLLSDPETNLENLQVACMALTKHYSEGDLLPQKFSQNILKLLQHKDTPGDDDSSFADISDSAPSLEVISLLAHCSWSHWQLSAADYKVFKEFIDKRKEENKNFIMRHTKTFPVDPSTLLDRWDAEQNTQDNSNINSASLEKQLTVIIKLFKYNQLSLAVQQQTNNRYIDSQSQKNKMLILENAMIDLQTIKNDFAANNVKGANNAREQACKVIQDIIVDKDGEIRNPDHFLLRIANTALWILGYPLIAIARCCGVDWSYPITSSTYKQAQKAIQILDTVSEKVLDDKLTQLNAKIEPKVGLNPAKIS